MHTARIGSETGFGEGEAAELFSFRHRRQPAGFLFFGAEKINGHHGERALHGGERAQAAVAPLEFSHDDTGGDVTKSGAAVTLDAGPEDAERGQLGREFHRERSVTIMLRHDGQKTRIDPLAHVIAQPALGGREQVVEVVEISSFEGGHGFSGTRASTRMTDLQR